MRQPFRRRVLPLVALGLALALTPATSARPPKSGGAPPSDWRQRVDQLWLDEDRPTGTCTAHVVRAMPPLLRGSTSGRGCLIRAIAAAREGDRKLGAAWLRAGLCESGARARSGAEEALDYAIQRYGDRVP